MTELLKLVECEVMSGFSGDRERKTYEVYVGDFVKVMSFSANAYWHDRVKYEADESLRSYSIIDFASILVTSDGGYVGHWKTITLFYEFLEHYMGAKDFFEVVS